MVDTFYYTFVETHGMCNTKMNKMNPNVNYGLQQIFREGGCVTIGSSILTNDSILIQDANNREKRGRDIGYFEQILSARIFINVKLLKN